MTTQHTSAQNPGENQTETTEAFSYGAPTTSTALFELFEAAADHLTVDQLEYLARMGEHAALQANSLSSFTMDLGMLYANTEKSSLPDKNGIAEQFWNISHQLDHIHGLIELAENAAYRLKNPKTEANRKNQQT